MEILIAIHTIATLAFVAGSAVVSARLLWLASRTRQLPEILLGGAIGCTAVLGYGVLIGALVVRGGTVTGPAADVPMLAVVLTGLGRVIHDFGVALFLAFVAFVFHRRDAWAWILAGALALLMWAGLAAAAWHGTFRVDQVGSAGWLCEYAVIWTYPLWLAAESFRYYRRLRPRIPLGLASPLVVNRFLLWGIGSSCTALAIWVASVPFAFVNDPDLLVSTTPAVRVATAFFGLASVTCSLFAFLPPAFYRRWFEAREPAAGDAMEMI